MVSKNKKKIGAIILAGGNSQRMGFPKPFLLYLNRQTFVKKIIGAYQGVCDSIILVLNKQYFFLIKNNFAVLSPTCKVMYNSRPSLGRIHSIKLGLNHLKNADFCFIQNCDAPFVNKRILMQLLRSKNKKAYTKPVCEGKGGHPILIPKKIIQELLRLNSCDIPLKDILKKFPVVEVKTKSRKVLIDINTPEEYKQWFLRNEK